MKILQIFFIAALSLLQAYTISSIELSDQATEYPKEKRVLLGNIQTSFPYSVKAIHALIHLKGVGEQDGVTIRWIAEDAFLKPMQTIAEADLILDPYTPIFHTFLEQGAKHLPPGHYRLELLENGKVVGLKRFSILAKKRARRDNSSKNASDMNWKILLAPQIQNSPDGTIRPLGVTDHFENSQHTIYATIPFKGVQIGTPYSIVWRVLDDGNIKNRELLRRSSRFKRSKGTIVGQISLPHDWPSGRFEVIFNINGKQVAHEEFTIGRYQQQSLQPSAKPSIPDTAQQMQMIQNLANWMLQSIEAKTLKPIQEHSSSVWQRQMNLNELNRRFAGIFNAAMSWREIFAQTPRLRPARIDEKGLLTIQAIYPGIHSVDVLLEGDYIYEDGAWRLFGIALEPVYPTR